MTPANLAGQFGDTTYTKVFVGGLAWETQKETMKKYFEQFGDILEAVVITDKTTGRSKGYGFVTFREPDAAMRACVDAAPVIDGRRANCNLASLGVQRSKPSTPKHVFTSMMDNGVRHLADKLHEIPQQSTELPNQLFRHLGENVELHPPPTELLETAPPTELLETARKKNQPDFPSTSLEEGIRKETEQAIKLHEDTKMALKFELEKTIALRGGNYEAKCKDAEAALQKMKMRLKLDLDENIAQLRRNYEAKCKEVEDACLWKKIELDNKLLG